MAVVALLSTTAAASAAGIPRQDSSAFPAADHLRTSQWLQDGRKPTLVQQALINHLYRQAGNAQMPYTISKGSTTSKFPEWMAEKLYQSEKAKTTLTAPMRDYHARLFQMRQRLGIIGQIKPKITPAAGAKIFGVASAAYEAFTIGLKIGNEINQHFFTVELAPKWNTTQAMWLEWSGAGKCAQATGPSTGAVTNITPSSCGNPETDGQTVFPWCVDCLMYEWHSSPGATTGGSALSKDESNGCPGAVGSKFQYWMGAGNGGETLHGISALPSANPPLACATHGYRIPSTAGDVNVIGPGSTSGHGHGPTQQLEMDWPATMPAPNIGVITDRYDDPEAFWPRWQADGDLPDEEQCNGPTAGRTPMCEAPAPDDPIWTEPTFDPDTDPEVGGNPDIGPSTEPLPPRPTSPIETGTVTVPNCIGAYESMCETKLREAGLMGAVTYSTAGWNAAVAAMQPEAVIHQSPFPGATVAVDAPHTMTKNPVKEKMPQLVPNWVGEPKTVPLNHPDIAVEVETINPTPTQVDTLQPGEVVEQHPPEGDQVTHKDWPETEPRPPDTAPHVTIKVMPGEPDAAGGCEAWVTPSIDFSPLNVPLNQVFPFAIPWWLSDTIAEWVGSPVTPAWDFYMPFHGDFAVTLAMFDPYMPQVRAVTLVLAIVGMLWLFVGLAWGAPGSSSKGSERD